MLDTQIRWPLRPDISYSADVSAFLPPLDQINAASMDWDAMTSDLRDEARAEFKRIFNVS